MSESATRLRHQAAWQVRPDLRAVHREWFDRLLEEAGTRRSVVEIGSGSGFFKEEAPDIVATDVVPGLAVDVRCDADVLPFRSANVGAIVMVDTLHHLPRPLDFLAEGARALVPGGRIAMIEPWITLPSWVLYRFFHHEECRLGVDVGRPLESDTKAALAGNAAIPYLMLARLRDAGYTW
jgi:SAM-dependent methyltransferase